MGKYVTDGDSFCKSLTKKSLYFAKRMINDYTKEVIMSMTGTEAKAYMIMVDYGLTINNRVKMDEVSKMLGLSESRLKQLRRSLSKKNILHYINKGDNIGRYINPILIKSHGGERIDKLQDIFLEKIRKDN